MNTTSLIKNLGCLTLLLLTVVDVTSVLADDKGAVSNNARSAYEMYQAGEIAAARAAYKKELIAAESGTDKRFLWQTLMSVAWFEDETGSHRESIEHSNRALEVGTELKDDFMIGRSLDWLGWAYASMGMYELAIDFYQKALEIGAPNGEVKIVPVWGLAAQELGAIYLKMGDLLSARKQLEMTTNFARKHGISVGVAEGGVHLAELSLTEGRIEDADSLAKEAIQAAVDCDCSPFNLTRAKMVLAKVAYERERRTPKNMSEVIKLIDDSLSHATRSGNIRIAAEAKLLLSKTVPPGDFQRRYDLVQSALETLSNSQSELRGTAESQLGRVFLDDNKLDLARRYLKSGFKVNSELFRQVDNAFITGDIAELEGLLGEQQKLLQKLKKSADEAMAVGALPLGAEQQEKLANELEKLGYSTLALRWTKQARQTVEELVNRTTDEDALRTLQGRRLILMDQLARLELKVYIDRKSEPVI